MWDTLFATHDLTRVHALASILVRAIIAPDGEIDLAEVREDRWNAGPRS